MTIIELYLISLAVGLLVALPLMAYCEFNSYIPGHRHVTYAKGLLFLLIAAMPLVNFIASLVCLWSILGDKVNGVLSKPMIRETK